MVKSTVGIRAFVIAVSLLAAGQARGVMVTYSATLSTSKGNPVTDLLILESDGVHPVQASVYPSDIPGHGTVLVNHDAPFLPVRSLLIGITEGVDVDGSDKTQIVMFLDRDFAAANAGVPFSEVFPGARHSETIAKLLAAVGGDAAALGWFTDFFFSGPAAGAAFASRDAFAVAEFTSLKMIGQNATAGNWMITSFQSLLASNPNAQSNKVTAAIEETAKIDPGPFDIELLIDGDGVFAIDKTVVNNTAFAWRQFVLQLGTGIGAAFAASTPGDGLGFDASQNNREESGAFPTSVVSEDRIVFNGFLPAGGTARFVVFVRTDTIGDHRVTVRQFVGNAASPAPVLSPWSLALLVVLLLVVAGLRLRSRRPRVSA